MANFPIDPQRVSKTLSYWLRHDPESAGLQMDAAGWVPVVDVILALQDRGIRIRNTDLPGIITAGTKIRYEISPDGSRIRATHGHSISVEMDEQPVAPPPVLYHGTSEGSVAQVMEEGLQPMGRQWVHLSADIAAAREVGGRHGRPVVLEVHTEVLHAQGQPFYQRPNGIWLTASIPAPFLKHMPV
jgi:putative RNA 2'-phosphotransferase